MNEKESDKMFTITLPGEQKQGEPIPPREKSGGSGAAEKSAAPVAEKLYDPHLSKIKKKPSVPPAFYSYRQKQLSPGVENTILGLNRSPLKRNFRELAQKYADIAVEEASEVPFMCYWPSYELLSDKQLEWYFCLRTKFRSYVYPRADLSYIFLYIYELINGVGIADIEDGLVRLIEIWNGYRTSHKNLDSYLPEWIVDYMDVYKCPTEKSFGLLNKYELTPLLPGNFIIGRYIDGGLALPVELIAGLSDYAFYKSGFVTKKDDTENAPDNGRLFLGGLPGVIKKIDAYLAGDGGGIFERYRPEPQQQRSRIPFRSAIFEHNLRTNPTTSDYTGCRQLREFITLVVKHYENALRSLCGWRGRLKAEPLPDGILKIIRSTAEEDFAQSRRKDIVVTVDKEKLVRLMYEAEIIRKKLLEPAAETAPDSALESDDFAAAEEEEEEEEEADGNIYSDAGGSAADIPVQDTDGDRLVALLSAWQREILSFIIANGGRCEERTLTGRFRNIFISTEADSVNENALEIFNDLLLAYEDGYWYLIEDYLDEIKESLDKRI